MDLEINNTYILFTFDDQGNEIKVPAQYLGVNEDDVNCFRIDNVIKALDEEEYYIVDPQDDMTVGSLIHLLSKYPEDKLIRFTMDPEGGTCFTSVPGTRIDVVEQGDIVELNPRKVVTQEY